MFTSAPPALEPVVGSGALCVIAVSCGSRVARRQALTRPLSPGLGPDFRLSAPSVLVAVPWALQRNAYLQLLGGAVYKCPFGQVG